MVRPFYAVALALSVAPTYVLAVPHGCDGTRWIWPGFVMGKDRWGAVAYPSKSSANGDGLLDACVSSSVSSSLFPSSSVISTIVSQVHITSSMPTTTITVSTLSITLTSNETSTISSSLSTPSSIFVPSSKPSTIPSTQPASTSTSSNVPSSTPVKTSTRITTTSSTPEPEPSSSSSSTVAPSPTTSPNSFNSGSNGSGASAEDVNEYLSTHNSVRAQHGASALTWNNTLAAAAQKWSDGCVFQHSGGSLGPFGENLAAGTGSAYDITSAVTSWTNEASQYNPSNPSASHFTQVVWKGSTQLGCAETSCAGGTIFPDSSKSYVCEYFPQGNIIGEFAANVQA